jgi:hypothetical protein
LTIIGCGDIGLEEILPEFEAMNLGELDRSGTG